MTAGTCLVADASLMEQVEALQEIGVASEGLTGDLAPEQSSAILKDLFTISPRVKVLYVTPEKIKCSAALNNAFEKLYSDGKLNLFVIDEAHCVSQWGHDFRPDYLNLKVLKEGFPNTPLMALTVRTGSPGHDALWRQCHPRAAVLCLFPFRQPQTRKL